MSQNFWLIPVTASIFLVAALTYLGAKFRNLNRQAEKFNRRKTKFIQGLPRLEPIETKSELPTISTALAKRRVAVEARTKKQEAKHRRLVEHLKDLQAKESE